jgi:hypothetical protein
MRTGRREARGTPVIVVSGLPRSGTSMAMQMLEAAGIEIVTDGRRTPGEDNPRGYLEDERVKALHKAEADGSWLAEARGKAVKIISYLLKHLPGENDYRVIFMRRDLGEVLASQRKMLERRGEPSVAGDDEMREIWRAHLDEVQRLFEASAHLTHLDVSYRDVVENPREQARRIQDFLGMDLDVEKMASAVDEELYRNRV